MEEKVVGGKEKKYVLYTVVGEERGRAGLGVWVVRVLLGALMLVALAVVPYLSLKLASVGDRTLVVFQPVPIRNRSLHHHHHEQDHHVIEHGKLGHVDVISILQSASLTRENYTELNESSKNTTSSNSSSNSSSNGVVTLHEAAVTLAVLEDTNSTKKTLDENSTDTVTSADMPVAKAEYEEEKDEEKVTTEQSELTSESSANSADSTNSSNSAALSVNSTSIPNTTISPQQSNEASSVPDAATQAIMPTSQKTPTEQIANLTTKIPIAKLLAVSSTLAPSPSTTTTSTTTTTTTTTSHRPPLAHKLVYVATAASGNHVGGFCVWKTDQNVTNWAFFYDNIPIEYQSHQDTADHEMRGMLAAIRTWSSLWEDHHVVLRSHHPSIKGADHPTRRQLSHELEHLSEGHFSYELEWRLRKTDRVVDIAYCLAHLHRDFQHWYRTFEGHVDELLGPQNWSKVGKEKRTEVPKSAFLTEDNDEEEFDEDNMVKM